MLNWLIPAAQAAGAAPGPAGPGGAGSYMTLLPVVLAMIVMYYFLIAMPQRKRQRQRDDMFKAMKRGDEVLTAGGIYGKITAVTDSTVTLEIAPKIKVKVLKSAVTQVVVQAAVEEETKE